MSSSEVVLSTTEEDKTKESPLKESSVRVPKSVGLMDQFLEEDYEQNVEFFTSMNRTSAAGKAFEVLNSFLIANKAVDHGGFAWSSRAKSVFLPLSDGTFLQGARRSVMYVRLTQDCQSLSLPRGSYIGVVGDNAVRDIVLRVNNYFVCVPIDVVSWAPLGLLKSDNTIDKDPVHVLEVFSQTLRKDLTSQTRTRSKGKKKEANGETKETTEPPNTESTPNEKKEEDKTDESKQDETSKNGRKRLSRKGLASRTTSRRSLDKKPAEKRVSVTCGKASGVTDDKKYSSMKPILMETPTKRARRGRPPKTTFTGVNDPNFTSLEHVQEASNIITSQPPMLQTQSIVQQTEQEPEQQQSQPQVPIHIQSQQHPQQHQQIPQQRQHQQQTQQITQTGSNTTQSTSHNLQITSIQFPISGPVVNSQGITQPQQHEEPQGDPSEDIDEWVDDGMNRMNQVFL